MLYFKKPFKDNFSIEEVKTYDPVVTVVDGVKVQVFKERVEDPNAGLSYEDFGLRSVMDVGAVDLLQPVAPISRSQLVAADIADSVANSIGNTLDSVSVDNTEKEKNENKND